MEHLHNDLAPQLTAGCDTDDTELTVNDTTDYAPTFRIRVDDEIMLVTATDAGTWTVQRAQENTAAASHSAGAIARHVITAEGAMQFALRAAARLAPRALIAGPSQTTPQEIPNGSDTRVEYPTLYLDDLDGWDTDAHSFTAPVHGVYLVTAAVQSDSPDAPAFNLFGAIFDPPGASLPATVAYSVEGEVLQMHVTFALHLEQGDEFAFLMVYSGPGESQFLITDPATMYVNITCFPTDPWPE